MHTSLIKYLHTKNKNYFHLYDIIILTKNPMLLLIQLKIQNIYKIIKINIIIICKFFL